MARYFIEVSYKGTGFSGFQIQENANSVQAEVERALKIYFKSDFELTGSSRTDAGVHALQNYFHFDFSSLPAKEELHKSLYNLNAILPPDIVLKNILPVADMAHCRFDALSRRYEYRIYQTKNPFLSQTAFFYPYKLDMDKLKFAADEIKKFTDFSSFSKRNTQVKTFDCCIHSSQWFLKDDCLVYIVKANRFLRGMVRGLVGTMLKVGRERMSQSQFVHIIEGRDSTKADFSVPPHGLFLVSVEYPNGLLVES